MRSAQFIMLSEIHGFETMQRVDFALLKQLNSELGVRIYLAELSPAQAAAFNMYVVGEEERYAREVFDFWAADAAQWGNREFFNKLSAIRELNEALPEEGKIRFIGTDRIYDLEFAETMRNILEAGVPTGAELSFATTEGVQAINASLLEANLERNLPDERYSNILPNMDFVAALPEAANEQFYGLWGIFHGSKGPVSGVDPLARRLNADGGAFAGRLLSVSSLCIENCENLMSAGGLPGFLQGDDGEEYTVLPLAYDQTYIARIRGVGDVKHALEDWDIAMFEISEENSPYMSGPRLSEQSGLITLVFPFEYEAAAGFSTDYMIAYRNAEPLTPWSGRVA
ncbi:MAG TPA: hypothetical protein VLA12_21950, partial [Planctomycetaceae bacterium]|nr:hypothetical protein [Planctomycetaceae bacterium]